MEEVNSRFGNSTKVIEILRECKFIEPEGSESIIRAYFYNMLAELELYLQNSEKALCHTRYSIGLLERKENTHLATNTPSRASKSKERTSLERLNEKRLLVDSYMNMIRALKLNKSDEDQEQSNRLIRSYCKKASNLNKLYFDDLEIEKGIASLLEKQSVKQNQRKEFVVDKLNSMNRSAHDHAMTEDEPVEERIQVTKEPEFPYESIVDTNRSMRKLNEKLKFTKLKKTNQTSNYFLTKLKTTKSFKFPYMSSLKVSSSHVHLDQASQDEHKPKYNTTASGIKKKKFEYIFKSIQNKPQHPLVSSRRIIKDFKDLPTHQVSKDHDSKTMHKNDFQDERAPIWRTQESKKKELKDVNSKEELQEKLIEEIIYNLDLNSSVEHRQENQSKEQPAQQAAESSSKLREAVQAEEKDVAEEPFQTIPNTSRMGTTKQSGFARLQRKGVPKTDNPTSLTNVQTPPTVLKKIPLGSLTLHKRHNSQTLIRNPVI